jgi:hypothetical protein
MLGMICLLEAPVRRLVLKSKLHQMVGIVLTLLLLKYIQEAVICSISSQTNLLLQFLRQLRHLLKQIANKPNISDLEDRSISIFIDACDDLTVLHASQMLNGTADSSTQI